MTTEEQEAADKAAAEKAKKEQEAADKAAAKPSKKKTVSDLKPSDDVVVAFKNPVHVNEDGESKIEKETTEQHVKYAFWLGISKDKDGNIRHSSLRGAKLVGYVEDGKVVKF